jgi:hypothetical protein
LRSGVVVAQISLALEACVWIALINLGAILSVCGGITVLPPVHAVVEQHDIELGAAHERTRFLSAIVVSSLFALWPRLV